MVGLREGLGVGLGVMVVLGLGLSFTLLYKWSVYEQSKHLQHVYLDT